MSRDSQASAARAQDPRQGADPSWALASHAPRSPGWDLIQFVRFGLRRRLRRDSRPDQVLGIPLELLGLGEVRVSAIEVVVAVALDSRGQLEPGRAVLEGQAEARELDLDFVDGLRSE